MRRLSATLFLFLIITIPLQAMRQRLFSTHQIHAPAIKKTLGKITAVGIYGSCLYSYLWLHNEEQVHTAISNALAREHITKAHLLLLARQKITRDNRPLSQLQYSCPAHIPQCRHNLLADVKKMIQQQNVLECAQLFKNRMEYDDLKQ